MVGEWMMDPIKIPWFRHAGSSWSLVYLVRGGSRPNLTEGSLSAAMGFNAVGELTGSGHDRNLVAPFGGEPPGSEGPGVSVGGLRCVRVQGYEEEPRFLPFGEQLSLLRVRYKLYLTMSWVLLKISVALRRRPRVGVASECVRPSHPPIKAVTAFHLGCAATEAATTGGLKKKWMEEEEERFTLDLKGRRRNLGWWPTVGERRRAEWSGEGADLTIPGRLLELFCLYGRRRQLQKCGCSKGGKEKHGPRRKLVAVVPVGQQLGMKDRVLLETAAENR
ncbi:hypothetical protein M5K25_006574 [Dendrobium thyrsiflorum]|uniref:Uncharacterized protein n=1 Tax=Dendrobium thyrsiflorum TaxID=117978 RepID=A0ABD0VJ64_DENTH